jgi:hypothetical protein
LHIENGFFVDGKDILRFNNYGVVAASLIFRSFNNPVDYDGRLLRELTNAYHTNEIGFFITLSFFATLGWSLMTYRRNTILEQKKRFIF